MTERYFALKSTSGQNWKMEQIIENGRWIEWQSKQEWKEI